MRQGSRFVTRLAAAWALVFGLACGDDGNSTQGGAPSDGGSGGTGAADGASGGGGSTADGAGGSGAGFNIGGGGESFGECAGESVKGEKRPLDMYIMLDQSGSMTEEVSGGGDKWDAVTEAFATFVQQPAALGIGVGLQFFPLQVTGTCPGSCQTNEDCAACGGACFVNQQGEGTCSGNVDSCNAADYSSPEVPIQALPGVADDVVGSLIGRVPVGATPTSAALQGAVDYAVDWAGDNPEHVTIVVLATDGNPTGCDTNLDNIGAIASAAAQGSPQVLTFVIGVGSSLTALNSIAAAGGTNEAFLVSGSDNVTEEFLAALDEISGTALGCVYTIPQPQEGDLDFDKVNVTYTPEGEEDGQAIPRVDGIGDCPSDDDGWYYDNPDEPTQILLCESSCQRVSADLNGSVDIVLGCETIAK